MAGRIAGKRTEGDYGGISHMIKVVFPYGIRFREDRHTEIFPAAELTVLGKNGKGLRAFFHIDSGATTTVLPMSDSFLLGIKIKTKKKVLVRGIAGNAAIGYPHTLTFQTELIKFSAPVLFVDDNNVPRILGREGIFSEFRILFEEMDRRVSFFK